LSICVLAGTAEISKAADREAGYKLDQNPVEFSNAPKKSGESLLATGTISFSGNPTDGSWNSGIARSGQGGSASLAGIVVEVGLIADAAGTSLGLPITWKDGSELSNEDGFTGLTTFDESISISGWSGFSVKSSDGQEFSLGAFSWIDYGDWSGLQGTVNGYRDGVSVASQAFVANQGGSKVVVTLGADFRNVDDVRIIYANRLAWGTINDIVIGDPVSLPVKLVSFNALHSENAVCLSWATAEEVNTSHFEIQRSSDAKIFSKVGTVDAKSASGTAGSYAFEDRTAKNQTFAQWYYRLKMVDNDGTYAYSSVKSIENSNFTAAIIYPNPVAHKLYLTDQNISQLKDLSIINSGGTQLYKSAKVEKGEILLTGYPAGMYILKLTYTDGSVVSKKFQIAD
jgi:hypothetical protein